METKKPTEIFGENIFSLRVMGNYLSETTCSSLKTTIRNGSRLDPTIADEVAEAMKIWAMERGATHYTHWFQPLTGTTAEKQEAFLEPDHEGGVTTKFRGKELIQGEPDASSFPSGGLRATFEARGYTAWDPTSPAFIHTEGDHATLCIPTVFCGYYGEALDNKTPLLRSIEALSRQMCRLAELFGEDNSGARASSDLGVEQEYFLVDKSFYEARPDLIQTGRTLFGCTPAKHQQMDDHYFGAIKPRVIKFMQALDEELWKLGIAAKTRHNEVSPAQFEIASVFEELNLAVDQNMQTMQVLHEVADQHGFACLMHEKPFAGVNGSGKHNNWSVNGPDGKNWLKPGDNPHDNARFLTMICALMKAVDENAALLRSTVASAGNDHRLGANEAPPAIVSMYLGEQLSKVIAQLESGKPSGAEAGGILKIGVTSLPELPRDTTDRNRTSPFAFTGTKFEFRAVGSNMSCAPANTILNTIVADALDQMSGTIEAAVAEGEDFNTALQALLSSLVKAHKRILFDGDNYTGAWKEEAARRGLPNLVSTPEALGALLTPKNIAMLDRHGVLSERELHSRHEVYTEAYEQIVTIEANCAARIARTMILPVAFDYVRELAETVSGLKTVGICGDGAEASLKTVAGSTNELAAELAKLDGVCNGEDAGVKLEAMNAVRGAVDALELMVPSEAWPLPTYCDMMFLS
ncbi:MAG: glutamine synthetase III [Lentisphaeria bacterium]|nr:glutamine synthetase III [Lentisphaeria bacterium]